MSLGETFLKELYDRESDKRRKIYDNWRKLVVQEMDRYDNEQDFIKYPCNRRKILKLLNDAGNHLLRIKAKLTKATFKVQYASELIVTIPVNKHSRLVIILIHYDFRESRNDKLEHVELLFTWNGGDHKALWLNSPMKIWNVVDKINDFLPLYQSEQTKFIRRDARRRNKESAGTD